MNVHAQLTIGVPSFSQKLNHLEIHSVSEYIIFDDLVRSLIKFDSNGEIAPDLVESWNIENKFKTFNFKIKPNQHFSDGSLITSKDIIKSFKLLMKKSKIVHGDAGKIQDIEKINDLEFKIFLKEEDPFFLTELSAPEYRIIKQSAINYEITSGPYYLQNKSDTLLSLKLNDYFPFESAVKYKSVNYQSYNNKLSLPEEIKKLDIIWPHSALTKNESDEILKHGFYIHKFNIGFSFWLSLNPNTLKKNERNSIKNALDKVIESSEFFDRNNLTRSKQLFLPEGPGRLSDAEIKIISSSVLENQKLRKLSMLLPKNIQKDLLEMIKVSLPENDITFYSNFAEYAQLSKNATYDIYLVNNDLSSIDLRSSILVTFNTARPLVWTDKKDFISNQLLKDIKTETNSVKRYGLIKNLGEYVMKEIIVYPLYYDMGYVFAKKGINLNMLHKAGAETSSWKIQ